jgi:hypothetical protein
MVSVNSSTKIKGNLGYPFPEGVVFGFNLGGSSVGMAFHALPH